MTETPTVPGRKTTAPKPEPTPEASTASGTNAGSDEHQEGGLRARFRAVRNDDDVQALTKDAKPFIAGAALVGGLAVDAPLTVAYVALKTGRAIQKRRAGERAVADPTPTE